MRRRIVGVAVTGLAAVVAGLALISAGASAESTKGAPARVAVDLEGTGSGRVVSSPSLIVCPTKCITMAQTGQQYTLTATAAQGSTFVSFAGPCDSTSGNTCTFTAQPGNNIFRVTFDTGSGGDNAACTKAKAKLAAAKQKLKDLRQSGASDSDIEKAKKKVAKAKKKKKKKCAA